MSTSSTSLSALISVGTVPDNKVHGANMGPTWVLSAQMGPMLATWTLLSGVLCEIAQDLTDHLKLYYDQQKHAFFTSIKEFTTGFFIFGI